MRFAGKIIVAKKESDSAIEGFLERIPVAWVDRLPDNLLLHLSGIGAAVGAGLLVWAWLL